MYALIYGFAYMLLLSLGDFILTLPFYLISTLVLNNIKCMTKITLLNKNIKIYI